MPKLGYSLIFSGIILVIEDKTFFLAEEGAGAGAGEDGLMCQVKRPCFWGGMDGGGAVISLINWQWVSFVW